MMTNCILEFIFYLVENIKDDNFFHSFALSVTKKNCAYDDS